MQHVNNGKTLQYMDPFGQQSWSRQERYYTPAPTPLEQKRACATYMSTTSTSEMLKKEPAAVAWKNISPPWGVGPQKTFYKYINTIKYI